MTPCLRTHVFLFSIFNCLKSVLALWCVSQLMSVSLNARTGVSASGAHSHQSTNLLGAYAHFIKTITNPLIAFNGPYFRERIAHHVINEFGMSAGAFREGEPIDGESHTIWNFWIQNTHAHPHWRRCTDNKSIVPKRVFFNEFWSRCLIPRKMSVWIVKRIYGLLLKVDALHARFTVLTFTTGIPSTFRMISCVGSF